MAAAEAATMLQLLAQSMAAEDPVGRVAAEKALGELQQKPLAAAFLGGFCSHVFVVESTRGPVHIDQLDANVRLMASIWLKHYVKRSWRLLRDWGEEDKTQIRQLLLVSALHEPQAAVAVQLALVLAIIARGEFPGQWKYDQLFVPMLQALEAGGDAPRRRGLEILHRLVKELASRRLTIHRKQFAQLSVEILPRVLQQWCAIAQGLDVPPSISIGALSMLLTATKLIATMLLNAFRELVMLQNGELVQLAFRQFYEQLERLLRIRQTLRPNEDAELIVLLDKVSYRIATVIVGLQKAYSIEFRAYLTPFLGLFWGIATLPMESSCVTGEVVCKRLQIQALQFFTNVLSCRLYKSESLAGGLGGGSSSIVTKVITAMGDVNLTDAMVLEAQAAVDEFFSATTPTPFGAGVAADGTQSPDGTTRLALLLQVVVLHYMKLQPSDLEEWQSDPEAFVNLSESLTAQESVRACAENLFLTLLQGFPQQMIPVLTELTSASTHWLAEAAQGTATASRIVDADAVLLAIGLGCYDLHECFDFEPWFLNHLVPLLLNPSPTIGSVDGVPVLRFRVVWLVSCWLAQLSANVRPPLYEALLNAAAFFRSTDSDAALKLRIVQSLESMVIDWGFDREAFLPFVPRALECLYAFFPQTNESESKLKVLGCLEAIIQACGAAVVGFSEQISAPLPAMWNTGGEAENLVRGKILQLLAKLLTSVKECDPALSAEHTDRILALQGMCLQVVRFATDVSNPDEVFLMESGLELWTETVDIRNDYTEDLHMLFVNVLRLMERDYEHVNLTMALVTRYVRLGQGLFWQTYHTGVTEMLTNVLGNVKAEASIQMARVIELIVATYPSEQLIGCTGVFKKLIEACLLFQQNDADREPEGVIVAYLGVFARLLMQHLEFVVLHVLNKDMTVLISLLDLMLDKFFTVVAASMALRRRKIWALGLCTTLEIVEPPILERLGRILDGCVDVIEEEREERKSEEEEDVNDGVSGGGSSRAYRAYKIQKKQQTINSTNPEDAAVVAVDLRTLVRQKLADLAARVGAEAFQQLLATVDSSVVAKLQ